MIDYFGPIVAQKRAQSKSAMFFIDFQAIGCAN